MNDIMKKQNDWNGNSKSIYVTLGASNHVDDEREQNDYYATHPSATEWLCKLETFSHDIWEPCCGEGHISEVLKKYGYNVLSTDLIDRGYGTGGVDFLKCTEKFDGDIITNPPYKYAQSVVKHALELISNEHKVAMFLKLQFLEGQARRELFKKYPPKTVYISSSRLICAKNGEFDKVGSSAVAYAWFVWNKNSISEPVIRWFN